MRKQIQESSSLSKSVGAILAVALFIALLPIHLFATPFLFAAWGLERLKKQRLRNRFHARWGAEGKRLLLVYSNSPHWQSYIEERWLPRLGPAAIVINWSERARWSEHHPLEAEIFRVWAGEREFNPVAIILAKRGKVEVIRFWQAFRDYKHGKRQALRRAEMELETAVEVSLL